MSKRIIHCVCGLSDWRWVPQIGWQCKTCGQVDQVAPERPVPEYEYVKPAPHLSLAVHGAYPQAARYATNVGLRSGGQEWWARIREILAERNQAGVL